MYAEKKDKHDSKEFPNKFLPIPQTKMNLSNQQTINCSLDVKGEYFNQMSNAVVGIKSDWFIVKNVIIVLELSYFFTKKKTSQFI